MRIRTAWLLLSLSSALCVPAGLALAQDGTTVQKTPSTTGTVPQGEQSYDAAVPEPATPPGEINQGAGDEGAGWDAAVEAAPAATPLIGEQQDAAVQRINAYFNGITNLQGSFDQVDSSDKHTSGRFYVQRPGKIRFDYAPPSALRIASVLALALDAPLRSFARAQMQIRMQTQVADTQSQPDAKPVPHATPKAPRDAPAGRPGSVLSTRA